MDRQVISLSSSSSSALYLTVWNTVVVWWNSSFCSTGLAEASNLPSVSDESEGGSQDSWAAGWPSKAAQRICGKQMKAKLRISPI